MAGGYWWQGMRQQQPQMAGQLQSLVRGRLRWVGHLPQRVRLAEQNFHFW
jgi:hypothetical protein